MKNEKRKRGLGMAMARTVALIGLLSVVPSYQMAAAAPADEVAAVRAALMQSALAFEKNDLKMAAQVWGNDESVTVFESGHANYGWADYRDNHLVPEMAEMKNTKYGFSDIRIQVAGNTAWATLKYTIAADVTDAGKPRHVDGGGLGTAILEKREGHWKIVHWHSSAPRRAPANATPPKN